VQQEETQRQHLMADCRWSAWADPRSLTKAGMPWCRSGRIGPCRQAAPLWVCSTASRRAAKSPTPQSPRSCPAVWSAQKRRVHSHWCNAWGRGNSCQRLVSISKLWKSNTEAASTMAGLLSLLTRAAQDVLGGSQAEPAGSRHTSLHQQRTVCNHLATMTSVVCTQTGCHMPQLPLPVGCHPLCTYCHDQD
jgi:hypothetical protein